MSEPIDLSKLGLSVYDLGIPVQPSWLLKPGQFVVVPPSLGGYGPPTIVAHPLAIVWLTYEKDGPEMVAAKAQEWIAKRIDDMADAALRRIDAMFRPKIIGVFADGPLQGRFAYEDYNGKEKILTRGDFELAHG